MLWCSKSHRSSGQRSTPLCAKLAVIAIREIVCCWMTLRCSLSQNADMWLKSQYLQQNQSHFGSETRGISRGEKAAFGIVQRRNTLKSRYLTAAFLYALRGVSYGIASRELVRQVPNQIGCSPISL